MKLMRKIKAQVNKVNQIKLICYQIPMNQLNKLDLYGNEIQIKIIIMIRKEMMKTNKRVLKIN